MEYGGIEALCQMLDRADAKVCKDADLATNFFSVEQFFCIKFYYSLLRPFAQVILVSLDALSAILAFDDLSAGLPWVQMMEDCGGLDRLEQLQEHENRSVVVLLGLGLGNIAPR